MRWLRTRDANRDAGFTMVELLIALAIFSIFLTIVLTSVITLTKQSTTAQVTAKSSSAELALFQRLDHEIRYADSINWPGAGASGDWYIEFDTPAESTSTGIALCTQWRFDPNAHVIQMRTWNNTVGVSPTNVWDTLLTNVAVESTPNYPFALIPASAAGSSEQEFQLTVGTGNANVAGAAISSVFVARNSSVQSTSNSDATVPGVSDTPICTGGTRP